MLVYTLLQELATQLSYINLSKLTAPAGDVALQRLLLLIAGDEGTHHRMFASCIKVHLAHDRAETLRDIAHVIDHFEMPAHDVIPDWARRGALIERHGVFGPRPFVRRVLLPALGFPVLLDAGLQLGERRHAFGALLRRLHERSPAGDRDDAIGAVWFIARRAKKTRRA